MKKREKTGIVLITGASGGIGKQMYLHFQAAGYTVASLSRTNADNLDNFYPCDVSSEESVRLAVARVAEKFGKIDVLVNNAGVGISGATELLPIDEIQKVFEIDYYGALYAMRFALPYMKKGAKIVNISSACALFALPYRGIYCSAKAAVNMLSLSTRMELADSGVKVVCICPGDIKSSFTANRKKYWQTNERYGESIQRSGDKIDSRENKRMSLEKAGKKIYRIAERKKGALYIVGAKYKVLYFLQRILPVNLFIAATKKFFG